MNTRDNRNRPTKERIPTGSTQDVPGRGFMISITNPNHRLMIDDTSSVSQMKLHTQRVAPSPPPKSRGKLVRRHRLVAESNRNASVAVSENLVDTMITSTIWKLENRWQAYRSRNDLLPRLTPNKGISSLCRWHKCHMIVNESIVVAPDVPLVVTTILNTWKSLKICHLCTDAIPRVPRVPTAVPALIAVIRRSSPQRETCLRLFLVCPQRKGYLESDN